MRQARSGLCPEPRQRLAFGNLSFAILALLPILVHLPVLLPWLSVDPIFWWSGLASAPPGQLVPGNPGWADGNAGVTTEALGHLAAHDWLHGTVPWWNPYGGVGLPLAAEMQNSALFLPFILLAHFANGVILLKIAMQVATGLASCALLRTLAIDARIACLCAILAEFNGTFAWYAHGPIMPVAFLPLLLLGVERCRLAIAAGRRGGWALVAVALAWSIYAGFPETAFLDGLFAAVFAVARLSILPDWASRRDLARRLACGGLCGLLLSAPASVPFLDLLRHAYLSVHADDSLARELPGNPAMLLLPYVFGPPLFNFFTTGQGQALWWNTGGYLDLPLVVLALAALRPGGRDGALRIVLLLWLLATFLKAAGLPFAVRLWDLIPFVRHTLFPVYITPSWEFALILLAALALEDWTRAVARRPLVAAASLLAALLLAAVSLRAARPDITRLLHGAHHYALIAAPLVVMTAAAAVTVCAIVATRPNRRRVLVLSLVLSSEALASFAVPLLSAARPRPLDDAAIDFLRAHLGLQRFYSMSVFEPNYGAYWRVASVNHNYLPVPQNWVDHLHAHINPAMDGVQFFGDTLRPPGDASLAQEIAPSVTAEAATDALADLAVRYVVAPHDVDPFTDTAGTPVAVVNDRPLPLPPGADASFAIPSPIRTSDAEIGSAGVEIGTYVGTSNGSLALRLCSGTTCRDGRARLAGAADDAVLWMDLDRPLPVRPDATLTVRLTHDGGSNGVAIWLCPVNARRSDAPDRLPLPLCRFTSTPTNRPRVFSDRLLDIYALPNAAPYDEDTSGNCVLTPLGRLTVTAHCRAPGRLIRRELFYPGWRVTIDGRPARLARAGDLFQSVALPSGPSRVTFTYRPSWMIAATVAMSVAILWLLGSLTLAGRRTA